MEAPSEFITTVEKSKILPNFEENLINEEVFQEMDDLFEENEELMKEKTETQ